MHKQLAVLVIASLPLAGCASPDTRTADAAERIGDQLVRDTTRESGLALQRELPRTGYRPLDRVLRSTTVEVRRGVEDVVLERPQRETP